MLAATGQVPSSLRLLGMTETAVHTSDVIFGAGLWRCLEIAFFLFIGLGSVAGLSYLYTPILKLMRKRLRTSSTKGK